jgi:galactose mutarotase-like enzyme
MNAVLLQSARASALLDAKAGGRLTSLIVEGQEVLAGVPRPPDAPDWYRGSFPLAPWAGTRGPAFGPHPSAMHGLVADRPWRVTGSSPSHATLEVDVGPGRGVDWPVAARCTQLVTVRDDGIRFRLEVHSLGEPMPAVAGYHPWFLERLAEGAGPVSVEFRPRHRLIPSQGGSRVAGPDLGERPWDDLFVDLEAPPVIQWPGGPRLTLTSNAAVWVYYERMPGAFCLEPWTGPDNALGTPDARLVTPGDPLSLDFDITWK